MSDTTRFSVQVNARNNVRDQHISTCYKRSMKEDWFQRLEEVIEADGRSLRKLSEDAKLGPNFVQQLLKYRKDPRASQLSKLLDALGKPAEFYVLTGSRLQPVDIEFLELVSGLDAAAVRDVMTVVRRFSAPEVQLERQSAECD
ncbi:helix-turn-helix transcriptional regulator [Salipiger bermudensis]|uniref:helix-turn-helix domain-containing protein n=1 Tax=Salipiger bermudensis TaxID=344736 RepID=UPI001C99C869|nr:helix-turn-helix transcriptional regulator [Salipiger bermudensis]MBY6005401.1 helix-turn-helix transcriptional regulator [Salipiger bermudensis]